MFLRRMISVSLAGFVGIAVLLNAASAQAQLAGAGIVTVTLKPAKAAADRRVAELGVVVEAPLSAASGQPLLRMPLVISNVKTAATIIHDLNAEDAAGDLPLAFRDDENAEKAYRRWSPGRAVRGTLRLSYRVPITDDPNPFGAAPPFELRSEGGVFSGLIGAFVVLPDNERPYRLKLRWDFGASSANLIGVSTLGVGERTSKPASTEKQQSIFVMGGTAEHEPRKPAADGFFSVWQGAPPFDARALMRWTHQLYGYYLTFFRAPQTQYSVYLRRNPINPGGGVEVENSFVGTFGEHTDVDEFKITLAHEMVHTFVGALDADDELGASWFSEGLAVYYETLLPLRARAISRADYLKSVNATVARYYTNALNATPNAQIAKRFWADTRIRVLPYDRGALYFAALNTEIAAQSSGKRNLDDVILSLLRERADGKPLTLAAWRQAVRNELGPRGEQEFDAMLRGEPIRLDDEAFGHCFRRTVTPLRRYELGFAPEVLIEPKRTVRGLIEGSAAAKAGLANGDEILKPVPQDAIQGDQKATLTLRVRHGGETRDITYLPRGETMDTYQWIASEDPKCTLR